VFLLHTKHVRWGLVDQSVESRLNLENVKT